jgi:hypothetical protein
MYLRQTGSDLDMQAAMPFAGARLHRVVLDDHARLPWRFFGRLTAAILAGLSAGSGG